MSVTAKYYALGAIRGTALGVIATGHMTLLIPAALVMLATLLFNPKEPTDV